MDKCEHFKEVTNVVTLEDYDGYEYKEYVEHKIFTFVDLSLHTYQCTQCKQIFNYSKNKASTGECEFYPTSQLVDMPKAWKSLPQPPKQEQDHEG